MFYWEREVERPIMQIYTHTQTHAHMNMQFKCLSYLRFSELNSDSRNRRNWSRPTWSFSISSKEKPHRFTRCWLGSLLWGWKRRFEKKKWLVSNKSHRHILPDKSVLTPHVKENHLRWKWQIPHNPRKSHMYAFMHQWRQVVKSSCKEAVRRPCLASLTKVPGEWCCL